MENSLNSFDDKIVRLRREAEKMLPSLGEKLENPSFENMQRILHELNVHQIELEIQNEELRRTQLELAESRDRYINLYDSLPVGCLTINGKGIIMEANLPASKMLGVHRCNLIKEPLSRFVSKETKDDYYLFLKHLFETGETQFDELKFVKGDGSLLDVRIEGVFSRDKGQAIVYQITFSDITERNCAIEKLKKDREILHIQKLETLGVMACGIAHDFNNLLTGILGNLDLALLNISSIYSVRDFIQKSMQACRRAAELTRQMLMYAGKGTAILKDIDLNGLVQENVSLFKAVIPKTTIISLDLGKDIPLILADPSHTQQVVMNLITNASEAIGEKPGEISISTGVESYETTYLEKSRVAEKPLPGRFVYVKVSDTGCGMDEATKDRIFDPFFTTKFTGRGLGMSAVLGIVRIHKGAIFVDSEPGKGTTIRVLFPVSKSEGSAKVKKEPGDKRLEEKDIFPLSGTILIVDDEETVRDLCKKMSQRLGFHVLTAQDGYEAIAVFREHVKEIKCVILDLSMPHMDGIDTFKELERISPKVKIIVSSGYDEEDSIRRFKEQGITTWFIQKPYELHDLKDKIMRLLNPSYQ